ncbi:MAG: hypothetical protein C1943_17170 [Halochromatium sp.]|nr:hypothetical protein [Halochromatium sp.]
MPSWIKWSLGSVLAVLMLALAAAAITPLLIDRARLLRDIEADISLSLGRPTQIDAIGQLRLLPSPRLRLDGLLVSETLAAGSPILASVDSVQLEAAIWPLVTGRLILAEVLIERPQISAPWPPRVPQPLLDSPVSLGGKPQPLLLLVQNAEPVAELGSVTSANQQLAIGAEPQGLAQGPSQTATGVRLPPIRRLLIQDGELTGLATTMGAGWMPALRAFNLTAGPIAPDRIGRLDATFDLMLDHQSGWSTPGLAEAKIIPADPLTEIALRPLYLRFGRSAGGQGPPTEIDSEVVIQLLNGSVSIAPFSLVAETLRINGQARTTGTDLWLQATANGVDVAALLGNASLGASKQAPITGRADIDLDLSAHGADLPSIIRTLAGEVSFVVRDGAVTMVDLEQLITGTIGAIGVSPEDAEHLTRFSLLSVSAEGAEGQFRSQDIQLRAHFVDVDGSGQLDLTTQQIALDLQAMLTKPPKGRGIKELEGIPIPVTARGPWTDPRWDVDVRAALDAAARRALREDNGLLDELEERTGIKGLSDGLRLILPGLLGL